MRFSLHATDAARRLSAETIARYREDGAILIRDALVPSVLARVRRDLDRVLAQAEQRHRIATRTRERDPARRASARLLALHDATPAAQSAIYDAMATTPAMHAVAADERLLRVLGQILSPTLQVHHRLILLMSMPEDAWHLPLWHQDWYYNEGPAETLTVYAPLQHTDWTNGSLLLALGEHRRGLLPHGDQGLGTKWHTIAPAAVERFDSVIETVVEPGDALVFNSLLPHSARPNRSDAVRFVINLRYRDLADPAFRAADWRIGEIRHARAALARKAA